MSGVVVREVVAGDVPAVVALVTRVLAEFGLVFGVGAATDDQLHALPGSYREAGGRFWVAVEGDQLLGTCGVFPVADGDLELRKMYLDGAARGRGVGKLLLDEAVSFARSVGARRLVLDTVDEMKQAIRFYEANGFARDDAQLRGSRCTRGYVRRL
ncbi:MAG: GNAT family N-acetyltransferase [Myxococcales bacterium]|nr:GNAT family N-acetyltransferase [Myxococcales bacterium]